MTSAIEERVVEMKFDNHDFEKNVNQSLSTIDKLKAALDFRGASKGMEEISKAADKVDVSGVVKGIETVQAKFSAMQVVGFTAIQQLTLAFMNFGKKLWDISFGQMKSGGMARALKIEQANFKMKALLKNMMGVSATESEILAKMDEIGKSIDKAVTGTAYGYDAAANVAAQLMASGMNDADKMYEYLRGIAGAAAMTGRSFEEIGDIFTTISSNGKLMTMQLRQFSSSGLNVSAELARQWGKSEAQINEMVSKGQISFKEFAQAMYDAFGDMAGKADETYAGVTTNIKAQLSRIGQVFAEPYIQNMIPALQKLKAMLVSLKTALIPVGKRFDAFMKTVSGWLEVFFDSVDFGRLDNFLRGIENLFWGVALILAQVKEAFQEMFPPKSLDELNAAAIAFESFTEAIFPTHEALIGIRNIIKALLVPVQFLIKKAINIKTALQPVIIALVHLAYTIISIVGHIANIIVVMTEGARSSNTFLVVIQMLGYALASVVMVLDQFLMLLDAAIAGFAKSETGSRFIALLKEIGDLLASIIAGALFKVFQLMMKIVSLLNVENFRKIINGISQTFGFFLNALKFVALSIINAFHIIANSNTILGKLFDILRKIGRLIIGFFSGDDSAKNVLNLKDALTALKDKLKEVGNAIKDFVTSPDFTKKLIFYAFAISILFSIFAINRLIVELGTLTFNVSKTINNIHLFTNGLNNIRRTATYAKTFVLFAASIMLVVGAIYELSLIPTDKLINSAMVLGAFAIGLVTFTSLIVLASKNLDTLNASNGLANSLSRFMISFSGSLFLLTIAIKILSDMNLSMKQAIVSVGMLMTVLAGLTAAFAVVSLVNIKKDISKTVFAYVAFAIACDILVKTLSKISEKEIHLSWQNVALLLGTIVAVGVALSKIKRIKAGSALVILAYAVLLKQVFNAFSDIASMPLETLQTGIERIYDIIEYFIPLILMGAVAGRLAGKVNNFASITSFVVSITVFIMAVQYVIKSLSKIDDITKLDAAIQALNNLIYGLSTAFSLLIIAMGIIDYFTKPKNLPLDTINIGKIQIRKTNNALKGIGAIFLSMAASVTLLTIAASALVNSGLMDEANADKLNRALRVLVSIMGGITLFIMGIQATSSFTKDAKLGSMVIGITTAIFAILSIFAALAMLATIPDDAPDKIKSLTLVILIMAAAINGIFWALAFSSKWKKDMPKGTVDRKLGTADVIAIVVGLLGFMGAMFLIVHEYVANIDKFKGDWKKDWLGLLIILGSFTILLGALMVALRALEVKSKDFKYYAVHSRKVDTATTAKMALVFLSVATMFGVVLLACAALTKVASNLKQGTAERVVLISLSVSAILLALIGSYRLLASAMDKLPKHQANMTGLLQLTGSIALMALIFTELAAAVGILAIALQSSNNIVDILPVIGMMMLVLGEMAVILHFFAGNTYLDAAHFKPEKILSFATGILILSTIFPIIAFSISMMNTVKWSTLPKFAIVFKAVAALGACGLIISHLGENMQIDKLLSYLACVFVLSSTFVAIGYCLLMLDGINNLAESVAVLAAMSYVIIGLSTIMWLMASSESTTGIANAGMIAFAGAIAAMAITFVSIANSIKIISEAVKDLNVEQILAIVGSLAGLLVVMGAILALGTAVGTATGGLSSALIAATAASFFIFGAAIYFMASAVSALAKTMIELRASGTTFQDLVNDVADGTKALSDRLDDFGASMLALITQVATVIIAAAPIIAYAITTVVITTIGYIMQSMVLIGSKILEGLGLLLDIIATWMQDDGPTGGSHAFYNLGWIIGNAVVNGIVGAFEGMLGKIGDAITGKSSQIENAGRQAGAHLLAGMTTDELFTTGYTEDVGKFGLMSGVNPAIGIGYAVSRGGSYLRDNWRGIQHIGDPTRMDDFLANADKVIGYANDIEKFNEQLQNGVVDLSLVTDQMSEYTQTAEDLSSSFKDLSDNFKDAGNNSSQVNSMLEILNPNTRIDETMISLNNAYSNGKISVEQYREALTELYNAVDNSASSTRREINDLQDTINRTTTQSTGSALMNMGLVDRRDKLKEYLSGTDSWLDYIKSTYEETGAIFDVGKESADQMVDGYIFEIGRRLSPGGGHGAQGMVKLVPGKETMHEAGKIAGKAYSDGLTEQIQDGLEEATGEEEVKTEAVSAAEEWATGFKDLLSTMKDQLLPDINLDTGDAAQSVKNWILQLDDIPDEIKTKAVLVLGPDTSSEDYLKELDYANQFAGGMHVYERYGYSTADEYARDMILEQYREKDSDTFGFRSWMKEYGKAAEEATDEITDEINNMNNSLLNSSGLINYTDEANSAAEATKNLQDNISSALDIFSGFNVELDMTANDVLRSFSSQLVGVSSWSQELQELAGRGIAQEILDDLAEAGPESYNRVHALYTMSSAQLGLFNKMYSQKLSLEKNTANNIRASFDKNGQVIVEAAENVGIEAGQAIQEGINESASTRVGVNEMEQGVLDAYKLGYEFEYINGVIIPEGIKDSLTKATPGVAAIFGEMGYQSMEAFMHYMNVEDAITMVEGFQETLKDSINNSLNIFDAVSEKEEISAEEMLTRMKENVKNVGKWARNLQELAARGMDEALLAELQALGPEGADKVAAFTKMTDAQLAQANQAFAAKAALPQYVADNLTKSYAEAGYNTTLGFVEGIDPTAADEVMTALGTYSLDALKAALDINSPSEKTREAGMYTVAGYVLGVTENLPLLQDLGTQMGNTLIDSVFTVDPEKITESVSTFFDTIRSIIQATMESEEISSQPRLKLSPVISEGHSSADYKRAITVNDLKMSDMMDRQESRARAATMSPNAQRDYSSDLKSINQTLISTRDDLSLMRKDIMNLQTAFAGLNVTLDGASVGKVITPYVNQNLGQSYVNSKRRSMR